MYFWGPESVNVKSIPGRGCHVVGKLQPEKLWFCLEWPKSPMFMIFGGKEPRSSTFPLPLARNGLWLQGNIDIKISRYGCPLYDN